MITRLIANIGIATVVQNDWLTDIGNSLVQTFMNSMTDLIAKGLDAITNWIFGKENFLGFLPAVNLNLNMFDRLTDLIKIPLGWMYGANGTAGNSALMDVLKMDFAKDSNGVLTSDNEVLQQIIQIIKNISNEILLPIAGLILAFILVKFIYDIVTKPGGNGEVTSWDLANIIIRISVSIIIVTHCWDFMMGIWHLGVMAVEKVTSTSVNQNVTTDLYNNFTTVHNAIDSENTTAQHLATFGSLFIYATISLICTVWIAFSFGKIAIAVYSRLISFLVYCAFAPVAFATILENSWVGQIGQNYLKNVCAYALQGFMMMIILTIATLLPNLLIHLVSTDTVTDVMSLVPYIFSLGLSLQLAVSLIHGSQGLSKAMVGAQ